jgi:hypothetical protein
MRARKTRSPQRGPAKHTHPDAGPLYLTAQGIEVTWDNPDIVITQLDGSPDDAPKCTKGHIGTGA